jgi:chromosome segregation ATPase
MPETKALEEIAMLKLQMRSLALDLANEVERGAKIAESLKSAEKQLAEREVSQKTLEKEMIEAKAKGKNWETIAKRARCRVDELQSELQNAVSSLQHLSESSEELRNSAKHCRVEKKRALDSLSEREKKIENLTCEILESRNLLNEHMDRVDVAEQRVTELQSAVAHFREKLMQSEANNQQMQSMTETCKSLKWTCEAQAKELDLARLQLRAAASERQSHLEEVRRKREATAELEARVQELETELASVSRSLDDERLERSIAQRALLEQLGQARLEFEEERALREKADHRTSRLASLLADVH